MTISWIEENSQKILYVDYGTCKSEEEMLNTLYEYTDILKNSEEKVSCIENYEGAYVSQRFMDEGNKLGKEIHTQKLNKNALLGIKGVKKILLNVYTTFSNQKNIKTFNTKEDAIKWIIE